MALSIASTSQFLYKRNFNENKWANVGAGVCKVQVTTKAGEFYFRINDGEKVSLLAAGRMVLRCCCPPVTGSLWPRGITDPGALDLGGVSVSTTPLRCFKD